jgi:hypothetical protein
VWAKPPLRAVRFAGCAPGVVLTQRSISRSTVTLERWRGNSHLDWPRGCRGLKRHDRESNGSWTLSCRRVRTLTVTQA